MPKKPTVPANPPLYEHPAYWGGGERWAITLADVRKAVALYADNQSAFAREVMQCDGRRVREWLSGGAMSHRYAKRLRDFLAKPTPPSAAARRGAANRPYNRGKGARTR